MFTLSYSYIYELCKEIKYCNDIKKFESLIMVYKRFDKKYVTSIL